MNKRKQARGLRAASAGTNLADQGSVVEGPEVLMPVPTLQIRKTEGDAWAVHVEFPSGGFEDISGFESESAANQWIAEELQAWLNHHESLQKQ
jgi:hypothetical protein